MLIHFRSILDPGRPGTPAPRAAHGRVENVHVIVIVTVVPVRELSLSARLLLAWGLGDSSC